MHPCRQTILTERGIKTHGFQQRHISDLFSAALFLCYYLLPARFRNAFLLVGSLGFYAWGDPGNILLLLAASAATYGFGRAMAPSAPKVRRLG